MKRTADGDVKFSFAEIVFSPFLSLWSMAKSKEDVNTDLDLDLNSPDKVEAILAESQKEIDTKVSKYGGSGKVQRQEMLNQTKVDKKDLKPINKEKTQATKEAQRENGEERGD